jgi:hypothetical protein
MERHHMLVKLQALEPMETNSSQFPGNLQQASAPDEEQLSVCAILTQINFL